MLRRSTAILISAALSITTCARINLIRGGYVCVCVCARVHARACGSHCTHHTVSVEDEALHREDRIVRLHHHVLLPGEDRVPSPLKIYNSTPQNRSAMNYYS
jgi:hypothetical protein